MDELAPETTPPAPTAPPEVPRKPPYGRVYVAATLLVIGGFLDFIMAIRPGPIIPVVPEFEPFIRGLAFVAGVLGFAAGIAAFRRRAYMFALLTSAGLPLTYLVVNAFMFDRLELLQLVVPVIVFVCLNTGRAAFVRTAPEDHAATPPAVSEPDASKF